MHLLHFLLNINHLFKRYREDTPGVLSGGMRKRTKNVPPKVEHWKRYNSIKESAYKILKSKSGTFNGFLTFRPFFQCLLLFPKILHIRISIHFETNEKSKKERKRSCSTSKVEHFTTKVEQKMTLNRRSHEQRFQTIVQIDCNIQNQSSDWLKKRFQVIVWVKTLSLSI